MPINPTPELQQRLGRLEFLAHQAVEGFITGMHKSPFHGFSVEFAEHRLHNPGESTKHLDWKLYARTDKMFVKRYEEETNLRCQLVIDSSTSMAYPDGVTLDGDRMSKLKFAVLASAALIELFRRQRDAVGLSLFNEPSTCKRRRAPRALITACSTTSSKACSKRHRTQGNQGHRRPAPNR